MESGARIRNQISDFRLGSRAWYKLAGDGTEGLGCMRLIIEDDEGRKTVVPITETAVTIGRQDGNTVLLKDRNVSRKHATLVRQNGSVLIEDLNSFNGVRINGDRIQGR